jgi:hypothetical protein
MKMKKIATKFSAVVLMAVALTSCNKKTNTAPEADKEFQSAIDAAAATMIATDIDMIVTQASEYAYLASFRQSTVAGSGIVNVNRDTTNKLNTITFINAKCVDGKVRNGVISINYAGGTPAQLYIRNPGHVSNITFSNYSVNQFKIAGGGSSLKITNTTPAGYTRSVTPITWKLEGELLIIDTTKSASDVDIKWQGPLVKTLINSTSNTVHPAANLPLVWTTTNTALKGNAINAMISYEGEVKGFTSKDQNFTFKIMDDMKLTRDFGCSPDFYINPEFHPFIKGKVVFKTGGDDKAVRYLYFGDEKNNSFCDNSGIININSVSYPVDFKH